MEIITGLQSAMTVVLFVLFLGIVFWAFSKKRKRAFDEAARIPFEEDEVPSETRAANRGGSSANKGARQQ